jgi:hypothetical protein
LRRIITVVISRSTVISIPRTILRLSAGSCSPSALALESLLRCYGHKFSEPGPEFSLEVIAVRFWRGLQ